MKNYMLLILVFIGTCISAFAQEWETNLDKAKVRASAENKPIVLVFKGSDWCAPCIKLDREVFNTEVFKTYAADHYVLLKADFPRKKQNQLSPEQQEQNNQLAEKYNAKGYFPLVVLLNAQGKVLGETGYKKVSPQEYIALLESIK